MLENQRTWRKTLEAKERINKNSIHMMLSMGINPLR
jgi:uncharacterized protein YneF (UPF0154 family)